MTQANSSDITYLGLMVCFVMLYHHSASVLVAPLRGGEEMKLPVGSKAGAENDPAEPGW